MAKRFYHNLLIGIYDIRKISESQNLILSLYQNHCMTEIHVQPQHVSSSLHHVKSIVDTYRIRRLQSVFLTAFKDLNSTVAKRGSVFIGLMNPDGAIWFRYQRAVLMR